MQPPPASSHNYAQVLPHVSFAPQAATYPWASGAEPPMALLVFGEGELAVDPTARGEGIKTQTVQDFLSNPPSDYLVPNITASKLSDSVQKSLCQTIDVPQSAFLRVLPYSDELGYLRHVRDITLQQTRRAMRAAMTQDDPGRYSVVLANRFPRKPGNYVAHLVSLEGLGTYVSNHAAVSGKSVVRVASLCSWSFTSLSSAKDPLFSQVAGNLARSDDRTRHALRLTPAHDNLQYVQGTSDQDHRVNDRLSAGYVPLSHQLVSGERTFGWYRGAYAAVPGQQVPRLGDQDTPVASSDAVMVYEQDSGVYDLSFAVAWSMGNLLALSTAQGRTAVIRLWQQARRMAMQAVRLLEHPPEVAGYRRDRLSGAEAFTHAGHAVDAFHALIERGLPTTPAPERPTDPPQPTNKAAARLAVLEREDVRAMIKQTVNQESDAVAAFIAALKALENVPFDHLVADARLLPPESVRFFYVDQAWVNALLDGAMSTGVSTSGDVALLPVLREMVEERLAQQEDAGTAKAGLLLRSALITDWPGLSMTFTKAGQPVTVLRRVMMADDLLLCLFEDVPDLVEFNEPHQEIYLGALSTGDQYYLDLRYTSGTKVGQPNSNTFPLHFRPADNNDLPSVLDIQQAKAVGSPSVFALQLIVPTLYQRFVPSTA
ncbi:hypothetical protein [Streptomyces violascens]|uniref:hypothetical protein n=1 Tax=Streptomyces violascens TaxID=67381 RepID=UPI003690E664